MGLTGTAAFSFEPVIAMLEKFVMPVMDFKRATILKAERLTPDSAAVLLSTNQGKLYVLYIEDFIASLSAVTAEIEKFFPSNVLAFMKPKELLSFEDTPGSQYYTKPDRQEIDEWIKYSVPDGGDYAFLALIEPSEDNESYWARRKQVTADQLPPELQKMLSKMPALEPGESFIDEWVRRRPDL